MLTKFLIIITQANFPPLSQQTRRMLLFMNHGEVDFWEVQSNTQRCTRSSSERLCVSAVYLRSRDLFFFFFCFINIILASPVAKIYI